MQENLEEKVSNETSTQSLVGFDNTRSNINAAGFEIKKAFSMDDISSNRDIGEEEVNNEMNAFDEYEAYIPERESLKHRESSCTLIESMEHMDLENDLENGGLQSQPESSYHAKDFQDTENASKSVMPSPLFFTRRMSAPMSGNDTVNVETGVIKAKSSDRSVKPDRPKKDLASLIRQKKVGKEGNMESEGAERKEVMEVQDLN